MTKGTTKQTALQQFTLMVTNLAGILPARTASIPLGGTTVTVSNVIADFQAGVTAGNAVATAKSAVKQALTAYHALEPGLRAKFVLVEQYLKLLLGPTNPLLQKVGIAPPKAKATPTVEAKAAAKAKAASTRKANAKPKPAAMSVVILGPDGQPVPGSAPLPAAPAAAPAK
jgi:hypothetical protein